MKTIWLNTQEYIVLNGNTLRSNLKEHYLTGREKPNKLNAAIDGMESLILALHSAGYDVEAKSFVDAILTAHDAICENQA